MKPCDLIVEKLMHDGIRKFGSHFGSFLSGYALPSDCLHSLIHAEVVPLEKQAIAKDCKKLDIKLDIISLFSTWIV